MSFCQKLEGRSIRAFRRYVPARISGFSQEQQHAGTYLHFTGTYLCRVFCVWLSFDAFEVPEHLGFDRGWVRGFVKRP